MKVIFLDHFGVMCLANKHGIEHTKESSPNFNQMRIHGNFDNFDQEAVTILNDIIKNNVEIVVSSDWKLWTSLEKMGEFYLSQGIIKKPIDFTKSFSNIKNFKIQRSLEIKEWIDRHTEISEWAAIDDMFLPELKNLIWVSRTDEGIKQKHIKENIKIILNI